MNRKNRLLYLIFCLSFFSLNSTFGSLPPIKDISYRFNQEKIENSQDSFHFMRSFVDYYYYLIAGNPRSLNVSQKMGSLTGWCAGDAHPENFGILLQENRQAIFTINDMDDSGPCPVAYDLLRLLVSSRLYLPNIDAKKILTNYLAGINGKSTKVPNAIQLLTKESLDAGIEIETNDLKKRSLKRKKGMSEVDTVTKSQINLLLTTEFKEENISVLDIVGAAKTSGGSAGLQRYEILITNAKKQLIKLELKELITPAIAPVASAAIPEQKQRMKKSLLINQGNSFSHYYDVFTIEGKTMLLRPKFGGNKGVSLERSNKSDNEKIIQFEAYILGRLHANSANVIALTNALNAMNAENWEEDISTLTIHFNNKFKELKN